MSSYREQVRQLRLTALSPDRSVSAEFDKSTGLRVHIDNLRYSRHNDESLAEQLTALVRGVAQGARRARDKLREQEWGAGERNTVTRPIPSQDDVTVRVQSPGSLVRVELGGSDYVDIRIRPGTVAPRGADVTSLTADVNAALSTALRQYSERRAALRFDSVHV